MAEPGGQEQVGVVTAEKLRPEAPRPLWEVYGEISEMSPGQLVEKVKSLDPKQLQRARLGTPAVGLFQSQVGVVEQLLPQMDALKTGEPSTVSELWGKIRKGIKTPISTDERHDFLSFLQRVSTMARDGEWTGPDKDNPTTVEEFINRELAKEPEYRRRSAAEMKRLDGLQSKFEEASRAFGYHPDKEEIDRARRYHLERLARPLFSSNLLNQVKGGLTEFAWQQRYPEIDRKFIWYELEEAVSSPGKVDNKLIDAAIEHRHGAVVKAVSERTDLSAEQKAKIEARRTFEAQTREASPEPK